MPQQLSRQYTEAMTRARRVSNQSGAGLVIQALESQIEVWKEASIGKPAKVVKGYHGAIEHTRKFLNELKRQPTDTDDDGHNERSKTGGYS